LLVKRKIRPLLARDWNELSIANRHARKCSRRDRLGAQGRSCDRREAWHRPRTRVEAGHERIAYGNHAKRLRICAIEQADDSLRQGTVHLVIGRLLLALKMTGNRKHGVDLRFCALCNQAARLPAKPKRSVRLRVR
jgi:hypothetical protein